MNFEKTIPKTLNFLEKSSFNFKSWILAFTTLISTRLLIEAILLGFPEKSLESFTSLFVHTFSFFLLTYLTFLIFLFYLTKERLEKISSFLLWGFWIIIFPPILDKLIFSKAIYKSFYIFDSLQGLGVRFLTFFGKNPDWGITWGTRVNILIALLFVSGYVFLKTKNYKKFFLGFFGGYGLFFILSCFPSLVVYLLEFKKINQVSYSTIAGYFLSPFNVFNLKGIITESFLARKLALIYLPLIFLMLTWVMLLLNPKKTFCLIKNIRFPQMFFNLGILFIGLGLGYFYYPEVFSLNFFSYLVILNLILLVFFSWYFSVLINDFKDIKIDKITNKNRPLVKKTITKKENLILSWIFLLFSLLIASLLSPGFFLIIISYHLLTWVYSCYPFRIKRFFGFSNLLIALVSLNFLIIGFMVFSENQTLNKFPWVIYWFLFLGYFFITPLKDLKDIKGDRENKVFTLPVLIGNKKTRLIVSILLFSFYLSSVYFLKKATLFPVALILGSISYFVVNNLKISDRKINYWVLILVFAYGIFLVKIIF